MRLLNSFGPNPRMVRMFMLEKGIELESVEHDLMGAENRQEAYAKKNPGAQMPSLELDDGSVLAETTVICDYLEELNPSPSLIGSNAQERAEARMWGLGRTPSNPRRRLLGSIFGPEIPENREKHHPKKHEKPGTRKHENVC